MLGRAPGIGHYDGKTAGDGLGDSDSECLVGRAMDEGVCAREGRREARAVLLEACKSNAARRAALEGETLGPIAEEHEYGLAARPEASEGLEHDVPPLLHREPAHTHEEGRAVVLVAEPFAAPIVRSSGGAKRARVDAEGRVNDARHARGA